MVRLAPPNRGGSCHRRGHALTVTVDEEAKTRIRHIYTVSAPVAGKVLRTSRHVGDEVIADESIVAVMEPTRPAFHDARTHEELQGALAAAEAAVRLAEAEVRRTKRRSTSRSELRRAQALIKTEAISPKALDKAKFDVETNEAALASAKAHLEVRRSERASVAARLMGPGETEGQQAASCCIQIRAPVSGRVLALPQESEKLCSRGPRWSRSAIRDLEIVAELLSADAVQIKAGAPVLIEGWGGPPLTGRVSRIDPAGFMKVSALGIEEQRVRTVIDLTDPPEAWSALGHDFRGRGADHSLEHRPGAGDPGRRAVPAERDVGRFRPEDGTAKVRPVEIGRRNNRFAQVLAGLKEGERIVLHPSDRVRDGAAVAARESL